MSRRNKGLSFYKRRKKISANVFRELFTWIFGILASVLLAFVLVFSVGMKTTIIGVSMEPSLYNGQQVFINQFIYKIMSPKRGDVVVFLPNGNKNSHYYVKRVVAIPGELVQIEDGKLYINGIVANQDYDKIADAGLAENKILLGQDEYFVMGDNCNNSEDSRSGNIGNIKKDMIEGSAWFHMSAKDSKMGFVR